MSTLTRRVDRYERNTRGRDLIVGDIHGAYSRLTKALDQIGFNKSRDRLFCVGDLVDRGPESAIAMNWLNGHDGSKDKHKWFFATRGNHEEAAIAWAEGTIEKYHYIRGFGGAWNVENPQAVVDAFAADFRTLPIAIELETEAGLVGIVHADCPCSSWAEFRAKLDAADESPLMGNAVANSAVWGRDRWARLFGGPVEGVRAIVVGHQIVSRLTALDNTLFIETEGWDRGHFTILDAATLHQATHPGTALDWSGT